MAMGWRIVMAATFALALGGLGCVPGGGGGGGGGGSGGSGGGGDADGGPIGAEADPRCVDLCETDEPVCAEQAASCLLICEARIAGLTSLCRTCLLEGSNGGACAGDGPCCPDPAFETSTLDCAEACADQSGAPAADPHPLCAALCDDDAPDCAEAADGCHGACAAHIEGLEGLCATCLLEDADSGACAAGGPCCPDFSPQRRAADCAALCP